jgi:hypothetical protein
MINGNSAALAWRNVGPNLYKKNTPSVPNRNPDNDAFTYGIIRVFAGEPKRVAPPIQNQKSGQSMLDFFGRGLNAQGPATHSNQAPNHPQQSVGRHGNFLEFLGNPFGKPSSSTSPNRYSQVSEPRVRYV